MSDALTDTNAGGAIAPGSAGAASPIAPGRFRAISADLNPRDEVGRTALLVATLDNQVAIAKILISAGANPNIADKARRTPLQMARHFNNKELTDALLLHGAKE